MASQQQINRVQEKLQLSTFKLNTLLDITNAINDNLKKKDMFELFEHVLFKELNIGTMALFTMDDGWNCVLHRGVSKEAVAAVSIDQLLLSNDQIKVITNEEDELADFDVIIPIYHKNRALAYLLLADFDGERIEISPIIKHLRFIQTLTNIVIVALENKRLTKEHIKRVEMEKELELAQQMQSFLFPSNLPKNDIMRVRAHYLPHSQVGGDYYDVIRLNDKETMLCIADVSGKGMPAALLMSNVQANLRALATTSSNIEQIVSALNKKVIDAAQYEKFITLFVAIYNAETQELQYLNAGHLPALVKKGDEIVELSKGCTILGMFDELPQMSSGSIKIEAGNKLVYYTDGLVEMEDRKGVEFGIDGVKEILMNSGDEDDVMDRLIFQINNFQLGELMDDVTLLSCRFL